MTITILYFASLREAVGIAREQVDLPAGVADAHGLRDWLRQRGDRWAQAFAEQRAVRVAVNQTIANPATPIPDGAEIAFFPPVTGG